MFAVVGTVPEEDFPLVSGKLELRENRIHVCERQFPVNRGTPALIAASIKVGELLGLSSPWGYLVGDIGLGRGSRKLYEQLVQQSDRFPCQVITFHYLQPDVDWHNRVLFAVDEISPRPVLIADAGFMYAAKMSGQSEAYELFTPDPGELAFLADEEAPHPFYTRGFILHDENRIPDLITRAYDHSNAAHYLLVKGGRDHIASKQGIHAVIDQPAEEALEAIGGTGDTLTGIVTALIASGRDILQASILAAKINRLAGYYANPTPASQVRDMIAHIPKAVEEILMHGEIRHGQR
jgi:hypothetical protein